MSSWFPEVDDRDGVEKALKVGFYGAIAFCGMICLGIAFVLFTGHFVGTKDQTNAVGLVAMVIELAIAAIGAWRFKIGKGLVWGSVVTLLFALEIVGKFATHTANVGWIFAYIAIGAALINGIRGAWAKRSMSDDADYAEVFE